MRILNCGHSRISVAVGCYPVGLGYGEHLIEDGETLVIPAAMGWPIRLKIWADRPGFRKFLWDTVYGDVEVAIFTPIRNSPTYPPDADLVITRNADPRIVDLTEAFSNIRGERPLDPEAKHGAVNPSLEFAKTLLSAISTAVSTLGPAGAPGSGIAALLAGLIGGPATPPAAPPNRDEIETIIESVVGRLLNQEMARQAAVCFVNETEKFANNLRLADDQVRTNQKIDPDVLKDMNIQIENSNDDYGTGTLHHSIHDAAGNPEMSRWILPQFAQGISTYLALRRLDILNKNHDDTQPIEEMQISKISVKQFYDVALYTHNGLTAAIDSMDAHAADVARKYHLHDTIKSEDAKEIVREGMLGTTKLSTLADFAGQLRLWVNLLEDDVKNGVSTHFWDLKPEP